jgi:hypothetical protein
MQGQAAHALGASNDWRAGPGAARDKRRAPPFARACGVFTPSVLCRRDSRDNAGARDDRARRERERERGRGYSLERRGYDRRDSRELDRCVRPPDPTLKARPCSHGLSIESRVCRAACGAVHAARAPLLTAGPRPPRYGGRRRSRSRSRSRSRLGRAYERERSARPGGYRREYGREYGRGVYRSRSPARGREGERAYGDGREDRYGGARYERSYRERDDRDRERPGRGHERLSERELYDRSARRPFGHPSTCSESMAL